MGKQTTTLYPPVSQREWQQLRGRVGVRDAIEVGHFTSEEVNQALSLGELNYEELNDLPDRAWEAFDYYSRSQATWTEKEEAELILRHNLACALKFLVDKGETS
jgi:hypothetical protein